ncbi:hypothetical protein, partial [Acinetobacter baumannii]|uniref:hypothetical protein n=1 Tax=Acinetobacter baumannii TaxID=470 RepID=UPI001C0771C4
LRIVIGLKNFISILFLKLKKCSKKTTTLEVFLLVSLKVLNLRFTYRIKTTCLDVEKEEKQRQRPRHDHTELGFNFQ